MNKIYLDKLVNEIKESNFDAMLISPGEELDFLINHKCMLCERFQGLFVKANGEMFYICNLIYKDEFEKVFGDEIKIYTWFDGDVMADEVANILRQENLVGATIGVNSTAQSVNILEIMDKEDVTFKNGKPLMEKMRIKKSPEEMDNLRKSSRLVDQVFEEVLPIIKPGVTENEIGQFLLNRMSELGGDAVECIVAFGPNASFPHYVGNEAVAREHEIVLMDYGCTVGGMYSDTTRTVFIGEPTARERELYELVKRANIEAEKLVCKGAFVPDIDKKAREVLDEKKYASYLVNRLGHGVGYTIHEAPDIKQSNPIYLEEGMAFSIEPGIYIGGDIGIRIEDVVMVNEHGECEILNKTTKEIVVL